MDYVTKDRAGDPPIPDYSWAPGTPDKHGSQNGCNGCDFRSLKAGIRCSRIPCQRHPGMVAKIIVIGSAA